MINAMRHGRRSKCTLERIGRVVLGTGSGNGVSEDATDRRAQALCRLVISSFVDRSQDFEHFGSGDVRRSDVSLDRGARCRAAKVTLAIVRTALCSRSISNEFVGDGAEGICRCDLPRRPIDLGLPARVDTGRQGGLGRIACLSSVYQTHGG